MFKIKNFKFANFLFPSFLVLICLFLSWRNYTPGTYLLGWDSLHSEFNFSLAFRRAFLGVWRPDQGMGVVTVHSHMADLPRIIILWLSSLVLPTNFLRYGFIFLCLILGPLGTYFFLKYVFQREKDGWIVNLASFLGAAFYLLNLGTLQHFFVPFEMFNVQYAFLPWLFLFVLKYLREGKKKNLLVLAILSFLTAPMAYAATLFYAYFGGLILFLLVLTILGRQKKVAAKRSLIIIFLVVIFNSFWLLPNIHSIISQSKAVSLAKINQLFSPEAMIRNEEYGQVGDVLINKNFLFEWRVFDWTENTFVDLMQVWNEHLQATWVFQIGYLFSALAILGIILNILKKNRIGIGLLALTLYALFFLFNKNYLGGSFYQYLYDNFDVFREGLRMPFTKFSIIFIFPLAFFFGYFLVNLFSLFERKLIGKLVALVSGGALFAGLIYFSLPMFQGHLISDVVRTKLPPAYQQLFNWFANKEGRIAKLPLNSLWGWENHNWGYEGSGFIPFGIENPLLDRDSDRWSPYNESFYNEAAFALYANDNEAFQGVLEKYQVKYLLLDESIINVGGSEKLLFVHQIKDLISKSNSIKEVAKFNFLTVYEVTGSVPVKSVSAPEKFVKINVDQKYSLVDPIFEKIGNYIYDERATAYPFTNLDKRMGMKISIQPSDVGNQENIIFEKGEAKATLPIKDEIKEDFTKNRGFAEPYNCDLMKKGSVEKQNLGNKIIYRATDGGVSCDFFEYPQIDRDKGYVLRVKGENLKGRSLKIYLQNKETGRMDLEELLPKGKFDSFFVILPTLTAYPLQHTPSLGYSLNLETRSFGRIASENIVEAIEFIPLDIEWLTTIQTKNEELVVIENALQIESVKKIGTGYYLIETKEDGLLELGQGFDKGWIAFPMRKYQILNTKYQIQLPELRSQLVHVKVNSWANGWIVKQTNQVTLPVQAGNQLIILFWPQLLEWGGMVLGCLTLIILLLRYLVDKKEVKQVK